MGFDQLGWLILLAVLGLWMFGAYNRVTALRAAIRTAWGQVDELLQARGRALDALIGAVSQALASETLAIDTVVAAQAQVQAATAAVRQRLVLAAAVAELAKADAVLAAVTPRLLAQVTRQAELHDDAAVQSQLQALLDLQPRLAFARQTFNQAGRRYNEAVRQFPTRLLAPVFGFGEAGEL